MIANPTWTTASGALNYFKESQDNYYQQEGDLGVWQGEAAKELGLEGVIKEQDLENILWGKDKDGNELVQARMDENGDRKRAGLDLTFSAPKSVSILTEMALASGNDELARSIVDAHNEVVTDKLSGFEKMLQSRETIDGETRVVTTGKMAAAKFTHFTSRPVEGEDGRVTIDPSLHTHAVVMNLTQHENGDWRAIESKAIYENYMNLGKEYRIDLAAKLKEMGYQINITDQDKAYFEISLTGDLEKDEAILKNFSKRSDEVKKKADELRSDMKNASESELKQHAAWQSRSWKDGEVDRREILADNLNRANELGLTAEMIQPRELDKELENTDDLTREQKIKVHLNNALEVLEENTSVFNTHDLLSTAGALGMRDSIKTEEFLPYMQENKELVSLDKGNYTTKTILKNEHELIEAVKNTNEQKAFNRTHYKRCERAVKRV